MKIPFNKIKSNKNRIETGIKRQREKKKKKRNYNLNIESICEI